jgi:hypothetical protein
LFPSSLSWLLWLDARGAVVIIIGIYILIEKGLLVYTHNLLGFITSVEVEQCVHMYSRSISDYVFSFVQFVFLGLSKYKDTLARSKALQCALDGFDQLITLGLPLPFYWIERCVLEFSLSDKI